MPILYPLLTFSSSPLLSSNFPRFRSSSSCCLWHCLDEFLKFYHHSILMSSGPAQYLRRLGINSVPSIPSLFVTALPLLTFFSFSSPFSSKKMLASLARSNPSIKSIINIFNPHRFSIWSTQGTYTHMTLPTNYSM